MVTFETITQAHNRIKGQIHRTPVLSSRAINEIAGCEIHFKCENFQKVGAFKFRGASNAVLSLTDAQAELGVATHSSGNHAQALALAARMRGIPATIVMPSNAPTVKIDAVRGYGAEIVFCEPTLEARETNLNKVIETKGSVFIHPYNNFEVIAGQGTAVKELIEDYGAFDIIMTPVGGGGLLSGSAISAKALCPDCEVIAAEPKGADDAYRSFKAGYIIPQTAPNTICDGLLTSLGDKTFDIIKGYVDDIIIVDDYIIKEAMKLTWERMKIVIEPSSAVCLAAIMDNKKRFWGKRIGIVISGGNVDFSRKFG